MAKHFSAILVVILIAMPTSVFAQENGLNSIENIALSISELTGIAISPLLVITCLGVYKNIKMSPEEQLPWCFHPKFLMVCGIIAGLSLLIGLPSDIVNAPKPLSATVKLLENKVGLLLITPVIFDMLTPVATPLANIVYSTLNAEQAYLCASLIPLGWLAGVPEFIWFTIIKVMMFFVFVAIWMLNYTFDALIFLCPFGWVDALLKSARGAIYGALTTLSLISPTLAFIVTLPIIFIAIKLFGWSVRRIVMIFTFVPDFFNRKKETVIDNERGIVVFSESGLKMPAKRMGWLKEDSGEWSFTYKKYFLFKKTVIIDKAEPVLKKGFLYSTIRSQKAAVCSLPPRYQKITKQVQAYLGIEKLVEGKLKKGLKATVEWVKDLFRRTESTSDAVPVEL